MLKEFREFIMRGNVLDLAVGVIIGSAFGNIVTSLVNDIIMPPIGMLLGNVDFKDLKIVLQPAGTDAAGAAVPEVAIAYGNFLNIVLTFVIIAFVIFLIVKGYNASQRKQAEAPAAPAAPAEPSEDIKLLTEIRDLLKK
ncbi:MAG: large-conductance mechanosensitive channel protein MscL [Bacteroidia bacterium]|nr:large-conductance mechanosensitive channel protein MscL [Bacteroidia bacterium]